jgi:hypothetical protein
MPIDRSKPFYFAVHEGGTQWLFHAQAFATLPPSSVSARLRGGMIHLGDLRGRSSTFANPLAILDGDVSVHVPVRSLVEEHRDALHESVRQIPKLGELARSQGVALPPAVLQLLAGLTSNFLEALEGVEDVHYALTWRDDRLESEGWVRTLPDSSLRRWLNRLGPSKPTDLMGLFDGDAVWMVESSGPAAMLDAELAGFFDGLYGEGAGSAFCWLFSPAYGLHEHLTGRAAGAVVARGMMAMSVFAIHEIKPDAKVHEAIEAFDGEGLNARLKGLEMPLELHLSRNHGKSGETPIHRLSYTSPDVQMAMVFAQSYTCFAVEGRYLVVVQSANPETELRGLLDRIRAGKPGQHPHLKAMERLMPDRHEGMSINPGALKPALAMFAMFSPDLAKVIQSMPDELYFSTALAVRDGHIHIRGDWPLLELAKFIAGL